MEDFSETFDMLEGLLSGPVPVAAMPSEYFVNRGAWPTARALGWVSVDEAMHVSITDKGRAAFAGFQRKLDFDKAVKWQWWG